MLKRIFFTIFAFFSLFFFFNYADAQIDLSDDKIDIDFFYAKTCPHCSQEKDFLKELSLENANINVEKYEISEEGTYEKLLSYYEAYNVPEEYRMGVPITFVEDKCFIGFKEGDTDENIRKVIYNLSEEIENCSVAGMVSSFDELDRQIELPIIGVLDLTNASPLIISSVFGLLDGFNACAMAALAFLIAVLIGTGSRKRLIIIGGIFILVSGAVYFFFIASWLNIFILMPNLDVLTLIIGFIVLFFGIYVLKDYFDGVICKLCEIDPKKEGWFAKKQKKLMLKMRDLINSNLPISVILGGVILVAIGINLIELICSFGLPVAFTKILTSYNLSTPSYYFYLFVYVFFYMLDDFIIFLIAVFTLNLAQGSDKYIKIAKLLSGALLVILGIIMIFFPDLLGVI